MEGQRVDETAWQDLVKAWRASSVREGWRHPEDWDRAPVETIARQLLTGSPLSSELGAGLGAARARAGAGAREILLDLRALYATAGRELDFDAVACVLDAWAEASYDTSEVGCLDVATGLHTPAHFRQRVQELLAGTTGQDGRIVVTSFALRDGGPDASRPLGWTLLAELGDCVSQSLGNGPCAAHFRSTVAVATRDDEESQRRLLDCRIALETLRDGALRPVVMTQQEASGSPFTGSPGKTFTKTSGIASRSPA